VKFFGEFRDRAGTDEILLKIDGKLTVEQVLGLVKEKLGEKDLSGARIALNQSFCEITEIVEDGDEMALFPVVSGG
jgi:molybdopterin synthase sulfur carrier subunit